MLDEELNKVDRFHVERERDALHLSSLLKEQLRELHEHRRLYHVCSPFIYVMQHVLTISSCRVLSL